MYKPYKIFLAAILTALFFVLLDALIGYYLFNEDGRSFGAILFYDVSPYGLYHRIILTVLLLFVGALAAVIIQIKIRDSQVCALDSDTVQDKINEIIPITRSDNNGVIIFANEAYSRLTGYSIDELIGQRHDILRHPATPNSFYRTLWETIASGGVWEGEIKNVKKNGDEFYIYTHIVPEYDTDGKRTGYIAIRSNVTDVKALEKMVSQDTLTGVLNRREFDLRIAWQVEESVRYGLALSLIYVDLDHFKQINDRYGHLVGDKVLKMFAQLFDKRLRRSDSFARIGGEEFAVILPHTDAKRASDVAEELRRDIENAEFGEAVRVTASFGVVQLEPDDTTLSLLQRADRALYDSKGKGRNRVTFLPA